MAKNKVRYVSVTIQDSVIMIAESASKLLGSCHITTGKPITNGMAVIRWLAVEILKENPKLSYFPRDGDWFNCRFDNIACDEKGYTPRNKHGIKAIVGGYAVWFENQKIGETRHYKIAEVMLKAASKL
jgi:hypothetical protein